MCGEQKSDNHKLNFYFLFVSFILPPTKQIAMQRKFWKKRNKSLGYLHFYI